MVAIFGRDYRAPRFQVFKIHVAPTRSTRPEPVKYFPGTTVGHLLNIGFVCSITRPIQTAIAHEINSKKSAPCCTLEICFTQSQLTLQATERQVEHGKILCGVTHILVRNIVGIRTKRMVTNLVPERATYYIRICSTEYLPLLVLFHFVVSTLLSRQSDRRAGRKIYIFNIPD